MPNPNGKLHASEIASLSLDILEHVNRMEIPHIPGTYVRLRIGCHSGKYGIPEWLTRWTSNLRVASRIHGFEPNQEQAAVSLSKKLYTDCSVLVWFEERIGDCFYKFSAFYTIELK